MTIKNKTALVTGGSSGFGLALAKALLEKGAHVHICGRSQEKLSKAKDLLDSEKLEVHRCDVSSVDEVQELEKTVGGVDILINSAGILIENNLEDCSYEDINTVLEVNLLGTIYITKAFLPYMKAKDEGFIVNVSSTSGLIGRPKQTLYCASKFGVQGFTQALSQELWQTGVFVSGFYPGGMQTSLFDQTDSTKDLSSFMDPAKVAEVVVFAIERDASMSLNHLVVNRRK